MIHSHSEAHTYAILSKLSKYRCLIFAICLWEILHLVPSLCVAHCLACSRNCTRFVELQGLIDENQFWCRLWWESSVFVMGGWMWLAWTSSNLEIMCANPSSGFVCPNFVGLFSNMCILMGWRDHCPEAS